MVGVMVSEVEVFDHLPTYVVDDIESDNYGTDEMTPVEVLKVDDLDDGNL